MQTDTAGVVGC